MVDVGSRVGIADYILHSALADAASQVGPFHRDALATSNTPAEMGSFPPSTLVDAVDGRCSNDVRFGHTAFFHQPGKKN